MIIAVEGIDGAGKRTLVEQLAQPLQAATLAFPRYAESAPAQLAQAALHGKMGDMTDSPYAMAAMFALDRHGVVDLLLRYADSPDETIILDRYTASNAAYTWARTGEKTAVAWVEHLEFERLGLPRPDLQVLVDTAPDVAAARAVAREARDDARVRDRYERDVALQHATYAAYQELGQCNWVSQWVATSNAAVIIQAIDTLR